MHEYALTQRLSFVHSHKEIIQAQRAPILAGMHGVSEMSTPHPHSQFLSVPGSWGSCTWKLNQEKKIINMHTLNEFQGTSY